MSGPTRLRPAPRGAGRVARNATTRPRRGFPNRQRRGERRAVRMVPDRIEIAGRKLRFAVSDNDSAGGPDGTGSPPVWAVNIHGYFAGGGMYWRESANLAEKLGWRVLNPSLPGFGGSDPMPWEQLGMRELADEVVHLLDHVGAERAVLLGHSMGGAVAVQLAHDHPDRALGIVYRDGAATPEWRERHGLLAQAIAPIAPDMASLADLCAAVLLDVPDLFIGRRLSSTLKRLWPDARRNLRTVGRTIPVGAMLLAVDLRAELQRVVEAGVPILPVWGCFDRIVNLPTAQAFAHLTGEPTLWVPGGHSWMLPRPQGQADILLRMPRGQDFVERALERRDRLDGPAGRTRATAAR